MKIINASLIKRYRGFENPYMLFSWIDQNETCHNIQKDLRKLEEKHYEDTHFQFLRVKWDDLKNYFDIPQNIDCYTIFYLRFSITVGTHKYIDYSNLENFFYCCNKASSTRCTIPSLSKRSITEYLEPIKPKNIELLTDSRNKSKDISSKIRFIYDNCNFDIVSKECEVYQFKKKKLKSKYEI